MFISVIIPVYEQYKQLEYTLYKFSKQKIIDTFEVIVIDDGSHNINFKLIENIKKSVKNINVKFILNENNMGRSYTRNVGIKNSNGDILVFCDADRYPSDTFIYEHSRLVNSTKDYVVSIGSVMEDLTKNPYADEEKRLLRLALYYKVIRNLFDENGCTNSNVPWISTLSGNMAVKNSSNPYLFDEAFKLWGFEHFEYGYRLHKAGYKFFLNGKAENYHIVHKRDNSFYADSIQKSMEIFLEKHPEKEIEVFEQFITGRISLQEFENNVGEEPSWTNDNPKPIYNKIFNC